MTTAVTKSNENSNSNTSNNNHNHNNNKPRQTSTNATSYDINVCIYNTTLCYVMPQTGPRHRPAHRLQDHGGGQGGPREPDAGFPQDAHQQPRPHDGHHPVVQHLHQVSARQELIIMYACFLSVCVRLSVCACLGLQRVHQVRGES